MSTIRRRPALGAAAGGLLLAVALVTPAAAHGPSVKVIATGLDNPRGIAVNKDGKVFVAEAGAGGPGGYGTTGKIITIGSHGKVRTYLGGLPSAISPEGETTGPVGVDVRDGKVVATIGGGPQDVDPRFDTLVRVRHSGAKVLSDIQAFRNAHPDATDLDQPPNPTDSNAYGVAALSSRAHAGDRRGGERPPARRLQGQDRDGRQVPERARLDVAPAAVPGRHRADAAGRGRADVGRGGPRRLLVRRRAQGLPVHAGRVPDLAGRPVGAQRHLRSGGQARPVHRLRGRLHLDRRPRLRARRQPVRRRDREVQRDQPVPRQR